MASQKPTILLVQGSFQLPDVYEKLTTTLSARGYNVVHPALPSISNHGEPGFASKTLTDDARVVKSELKRLVEKEGKQVLVLMHSYGGLVGSEAVSEDLTRQSRKERGLDGGVTHLFYMAAFVLPAGQSVLGAFGESPNNLVHPDGSFTMKDAGRLLYGEDLAPEEARAWEARMVSQSYAVQTTVLTRAAYEYVPSTYLVTERDQAVAPAYQEMFAKAAKAAEVLRIEGGHSPWFSKAEEIVNMVDEVVKKADTGARHE